MDIGSILLILALLVFVAAYVLRPLREEHAQTVGVNEQRLSALMAERERLLEALMELDSDHELGKVPEEIYADQRIDLVAHGAEVLRQIDTQVKQAGEAKARLEEIPVGRKTSKVDDDELEEMIAARKRTRRGTRAGEMRYCANCGNAILADDRYCPKCGKVQS